MKEDFYTEEKFWSCTKEQWAKQWAYRECGHSSDDTDTLRQLVLSEVEKFLKTAHKGDIIPFWTKDGEHLCTLVCRKSDQDEMIPQLHWNVYGRFRNEEKLLNLISYWGGKEQLEKAVDDWVDRGRKFFNQERDYEATFNNKCVQLLNLSSEDLIFVKDNNLTKSLVGVCCSFELWR